MADKVIGVTLKANTAEATTGMKQFSQATDQASKSVGNTNEELKETGGAFGNLKQGLGQLPGPLKQVTGGIETVNTSLKALAANPIVLVVTLLVAALVALYKAFASTEEGAEKIEQIMKGLGAVITVIRDRVLKFASAIVSFFKGDFKEAIEEASEAVTGFGKDAVQAFNDAADATRQLQEAEDDYNRRISVNRALLNRDLAASKELISDTTASYKDRLKAVNDVQAAQEKQAADELANAQKVYDQLKRNADRDKQSAQAKDDLAEAEKNLAAVQQQAAADERAINKQRTAIEAEENQKRTENARAAAEERKKIRDEEEAHEKALDDARKQRLSMGQADITTQQQLDDDIKAKQQEDQEKQDKIDKERSDKQIALLGKQKNALLDFAKTSAQTKNNEMKLDSVVLQHKQTIFAVTSNLLGSLANLAGKQTVVGKALAIAQTTIDTYQSAIASYKSLAGIPYIGPVLGAAAAAAAIANGLATVKQIASTKIPGAADSTGAAVPGAPSLQSPAAPIAPQQQGTTIDQSSIAGIGNAAVGRSYVVESDITHDQSRSERLNRAARLGG